MKKYSVGIDARLYSQTGVGVYIRNLLYNLDRINQDKIIFTVYMSKKDIQLFQPASQQFVKKVADFHWHSLNEQLGFLMQINKDNLDLMHFTYFSYPVLYRQPFIATVHDVTPLLFKTGKASTKNPIIYTMKQLIFQYVLRSQVRNSTKVITPTQTVAEQIGEIYGNTVKQKTVAVYEGIDYELKKTAESNLTIEPSFAPLSGATAGKQWNNDFFLYVGNFYPHKNVEELVHAFSEINDPIQLVLIGPKDYFSDRLLQLINQLKQGKKIILFHAKSRSDLLFFYKHAKALIHPSLSEGFGLPLVEAMYFNLPIIGSNISVFKELLGDTYTSFDPQSREDMVDKIQGFLKSPTKPDYSKLLEKYSFETMTQKTLEIYLNALALPL